MGKNLLKNSRSKLNDKQRVIKDIKLGSLKREK
jgi:hypothetical protein